MAMRSQRKCSIIYFFARLSNNKIQSKFQRRMVGCYWHKKGNSGIDGAMQLYSTKRKVSQPLAGHSGTFIDATVTMSLRHERYLVL